MVEVPCNFCGCEEFSIRYRPRKNSSPTSDLFGAGHFVRGTQRIVQCKKCQLVYVNPRLEHQVIQSGYENSHCEEYLSQQLYRKLTFERAIAFLEKYAPNKGKLLDVGCASGLFLSVAQESGWDINGVEPCRWLVERAPSVCRRQIRIGTLRQTQYPSENFDVVTLWDVLEHFTDPKSELIEIRRILKTGGVLVINFPDINSLTSKMTRRAWWHLVCVHLYYFSTKTLTRALADLGFALVDRRRHLQTLQLAYLIELLRMYHNGVGQLAGWIAKRAQLGKLAITFSSGETNLIARKN